MATRAADDTNFIAKRIAELRKEAADNLNCLCARPDGGGEPDRSKCPVHREPAPVGMLNGFRPGIERIDNWVTWEPGLSLPPIDRVLP